jgi:hypothetical protein
MTFESIPNPVTLVPETKCDLFPSPAPRAVDVCDKCDGTLSHFNDALVISTGGKQLYFCDVFKMPAFA